MSRSAGARPPGRPARAAELAALGPFFAVATHEPGAPAAAPWRPMAELTADPDVLRERVAAVRGLLAAGGGRPVEAVEPRVAASVTHLGLVARVLSPYTALAARYGQAPPAGLEPAALHWQPVLGGPYPLSLPCGGAHPAASGEDAPYEDPAALAGALAERLLDGPVRELSAPFEGLGVSPHILRGNAASAVNGAAVMVAAARPALSARARTLAGLLLDRAPLRGAAGHAPTGAFRRRSCCLIYRAAPGRRGALCGDCVLRRGTG